MEDGPSARAVLAAVVERTRAPGFGGTIDAMPFTELEDRRGRARQHQRPARRRGDPLRRPLPAEDVPPPRGGRQPGARARPLPERARAGPHARHRRRDRIQPPPRRAEHARGAGGLRPQRRHRLGARPRGAAPVLRARADAPPRGRARPPPRRAGWSSWPATSRPPAVRDVDRRLPGSRGAARTAHRRDAPGARRRTSTTRASRPVPYSTLDRRSHYQSVRNLVGKTLRLLRDSLDRLPARARRRGAAPGRRSGAGAEGVRALSSASVSPACRSARTATTTSNSCSTRARTSSSSTSTARRRRRWPSAAASTTACATSRA